MTLLETLQLVGSVGSVVGVIVVGYLNYRSSHDTARTESEVAQQSTVTTATDNLVKSLAARVDQQDEKAEKQDEAISRLEGRVQNLESRNHGLMQYIRRLWAAMREAGTPIPEPPEELEL